jgi:hypothetical protein
MSAEEEKRSLDPRLRVLYLAAVAIGIFFLRKPWQVGALLGAHAVVWLAVRLGAARLVRQVTKLWGFALFILVSYGVTAEDPAVDDWVRVPVGAWSIPINMGGAIVGLVMVLRVLCVVMASQIARAGDGRAIAAGLGKLGVPPVVAGSIDAVLALLGGGGPGSGMGRGGGRGRGRGGEESKEGFWAALKRLGRGDVGAITHRIDRQIGRVEDHLDEHPEAKGGGDVAIIAGIALTMLGIKALKVLPSIPFAPGHKLVLLTPLYIVASLKTRSRFGATLTGLTMGFVSFLLGDGRYGIFEILKHVTPGLMCDLLVPLMVRGRVPGRAAWTALGAVLGCGRFATIFVVTLTVQAPKIAFAMLVPGMLVHTTFGALSGLVSGQLVRAMIPERQPAREGSVPAMENEAK